ncbi:conserved hypothetical protein [Methanococcus maripaludis C5]|uniref:SCP2 domain-containing protein n=1 Tax=Methanococcus maripaludis (strain C5 / ATCC BAA-1333) TaxID=402880 RepID=A4FZM5_METM5|nr:hypothetical protein [Methanococcus maripaludis]ABO35659.1 conserved hypothetical protein [Methanococcus maripaludis C5]
MKIIKAALVLVFALILSSASAETVLISDSSDLFSKMKTIAMKYAENLEDIPFATNIASNERINLNVDMGEEDLLISIIVIDGKITSFEKGSLDDATMNVYTDENTVREILDSDNPVSSAQTALKAGNIKMEGVGLVNSIKISIANILMSFF